MKEGDIERARDWQDCGRRSSFQKMESRMEGNIRRDMQKSSGAVWPLGENICDG